MDSRLKTLFDSNPHSKEKDPYAALLHSIKIRKLFADITIEAYELIDELPEHSPFLDIVACRNKLIDLFCSCRLFPDFNKLVKYVIQLKKVFEGFRDRPQDFNFILKDLNRIVEDSKSFCSKKVFSWERRHAADFYTMVIEHEEEKLTWLEQNKSNHDNRVAFLKSMDRNKYDARNRMHEYCEKLRWKGFRYQVDFLKIMQTKVKEACNQMEKFPASADFKKEKYRQLLITSYNGEMWDFQNREQHLDNLVLILKKIDQKWKILPKIIFNRCLNELSLFNCATLKSITPDEKMHSPENGYKFQKG